MTTGLKISGGIKITGGVSFGGSGGGGGGTNWGFEDASDLDDFTFKQCTSDTSASSYVSRTNLSASQGSYSLENDTDYVTLVGIIDGDTDEIFTLDMDFQYNSGESQYAGLFFGSYRDGSGDIFEGVLFCVNNSAQKAYLTDFLGDGNPSIYGGEHDSYDFSGDSFSDGSWYRLQLHVETSGSTVTVTAKLMSTDGGTTYDTLSGGYTSDANWTTDKGLYMFNEAEPTTHQRVDYLRKS